MSRPRDAQRQRIYNSEEVAWEQATWQHGDKLTLAECQTIIDKVWRSKKVRARYLDVRLLDRHSPRFPKKPVAKPGVNGSRGGRAHCWPTRHEITLPNWTRMDWMVLHELAHALTYDRHRAAHDWKFAECYLYLVHMYLGHDAYVNLQEQFRRHKVQCAA